MRDSIFLYLHDAFVDVDGVGVEGSHVVGDR